MGNQSKSVVDFQAQQAGQPAQEDQQADVQQEQTQPVDQAQGNQQQAGLKKEEVLDLIKQAISEAVPQALDGFRREEQSQRDKLEKRIKQEVTKKVAALQSVNITPTQEQLQKLTDVATAEVLGEQSQDVLKTQPAQGEKAQEQPKREQQTAIDPVTQMALEYMMQTGVELVEGDPELAIIQKTENAVEFLTAVKAAVDAKKARLAQGRLPLTGGNNASNIPLGRKSIDDFTEAYKH
jgi:hypothetical protein